MWSFFDGMMAISVDRLLVSLLELKYKEIVTLKSTYIITAVFWFLSIVEGSFSISHTRITRWFSDIVLTSCSMISIASYKEIFRALSHHQAQLQDHVQQQPSQPNAKAMNLGRYIEALYSALWVQLSISSMLCARNYNVANDHSKKNSFSLHW